MGAASSEDLLAVIGRQGYTARHVVITGGEPCIHDLLPLTDLLEKNGFSCQIETSGTHEVRCTPNTRVTVSPKLNTRGGYEVLSQAPSELTKSNTQLDAYVISKHWTNCWRR